MRTYVRVKRGDDPPRRPRRVLRLGRAARRSPPARAAGDRRRRAWCWRPATRRGRSASARRWAARRRGGCARRRSSCRRACPAYSRRARRCSRSSTTPRRWSRGSRSTRRSSTSAGCGGSRARPVEIAARLRRDGAASGSGCRSRSASPARSSWPRWRAAWPSPTGCWSVAARTGSSRSSTRCRSSGCGASGR